MKKKEFLEQLKQIATSAPLTPAIDDETNFDKVNKFVLVFNIKEGKNIIRSPMLYKVYADWSEAPMKRKNFYNEFAKLFMGVTKDGKSYYSLNYKPGGLVKKGKELIDNRVVKKVHNKDD